MRLPAKLLLSEEQLEGLGVVANCSMNRSRGLSSYGRELGLAPLDFLAQFREPRWLDLCCGEGRALWEAAGQASDVCIDGVDLAGHFRTGDAAHAVNFSKTPLRLLAPDHPYHLTTCVHGLHFPKVFPPPRKKQTHYA